MADYYAYTIAQCDVPTERHPALQSYRDKRRLWLSWINKDEHHAIWQVLSSMVWTDVSFKVLTQFATNDENNALSNTLLGQALIDGHVATQVLAIRRLIDDRSDVISLRRLVKDLRRNFGLFTRENFVCFDGLPYDYEAVQRKEMMERVGQGFWGQTSGWRVGTSRMAHANSSTGCQASVPRNEREKIAFQPTFLQRLKRRLTTAALTNWRNGATPILRTPAAQNRGKGSPTSW